MPNVLIDALAGIDESHQAPPGAAAVIDNMRVDPLGGWATGGGNYEIDTALNTTIVGNVLAMAHFTQHNGRRRWLVVEYDTGGAAAIVAWAPGETGSKIALASGRTLVPDGGTQFVVVGNWLYMFNGVDQPIRWDGTEVVEVGFNTTPPPPVVDELPEKDRTYERGNPSTGITDERTRGLGWMPAVPTTGAGAKSELWRYGYCYTWVNDLGMESAPSDTVFVSGKNTFSDPPVGGEGRTLAHVWIPDAPSNVRGIRLYRTENLVNVPVAGDRHTQTYRLAEFACCVGFTFVDYREDTDLGLPLGRTSLGDCPVESRVAAMFRSTLFVASGDVLRYSMTRLIEQFPPNYAFFVGDRDNGEITALHATDDALLVFKRRGIYSVTGPPGEFRITVLSEDLGCASPNGVVTVPDVGTLFISDSGIHAIVGRSSYTEIKDTRIVHVGLPVYKTFRRRVALASLQAASAVLYRRDKEVWFLLPADGSPTPSLILKFHWEKGWWSSIEDWNVARAVETQDHLGYLYLGCWGGSGQSDGVYHYGGYEVIDSLAGDPAVSSTYRSAWLDFGDRWSRLQISHVSPLVVASGTRALALRYWQERRHTAIASSRSHASTDTEYDRPLWGSDPWDTEDEWTDYDPTPITFSIEQHSALEFQWEVSCSKMHLLGVALRAAGQKKNEANLRIEDALGHP